MNERMESRPETCLCDSPRLIPAARFAKLSTFEDDDTDTDTG